ncbi:MAG: YsnF/AvaK domain-containing protein [Acetobacteraceae bacterium]|nr:YsnF/AvaK domain-containing protein [Acetobacteraceae bacterium]
MDDSFDDDGVMTVPLLREFARIGKRVRETGRVRIALRTETAEERVAQTLRRDAVEVERVPVGRELAPGEPIPVPRHDPDGTYVVPVLEEVLVVERRLVLREEVRLRPSATEEVVEHTVTLRRQRAEVSRDPA